MKQPAGRSLKWQLIRRLVVLQTLILLFVLAIMFLKGDLFAFRSTDRTIEALQHAIQRDAGGGLELRDTTELTALRGAEPGLWFIIRDAQGRRISEGPVPAIFTTISEALPGIGQARFGSTVDGAAMDRPEARMRTVYTTVGEMQIMTGTESGAPLAMIALGLLLVFIKVGLPILVVIVFGILIATPIVVRGAVAGIAKAEKQAALIDIGQRGVRLATAGTPPEIASLIRAVNEALRRLDDGYERHQRFLADAAHELRTPIAILGTRIAALPQLPERMQLIADVARLTTLTEQLLDIERLRRDIADFKPVSLLGLGKRVVSDMAPLAFPAGYGLDLFFEGDDDPVQGDEAALERALASLIQNAIDHGGGKGTIHIRISSNRMEVCDDGPGIPQEECERIFEPFYRLKPRPRGTGLGLHLVRQIVELHGGTVHAGASPTGGARLTIDLAPITRTLRAMQSDRTAFDCAHKSLRP
ncbi:HAMP domain-containing histidine kinase [Rhizobium sp. P38BS-XIX]|uniref:sensor histidine kinase n=1 Tax=Rhizobium sp. P38BS-XIX TaxID=2726740 RepID=UPI0014577A80|nr:HAMP domain-containing sensor histidine kinase [Rhizobium sp. P38BS-XIX]NLS01472.1 HAMP domain-containing histidine kinase [Rhizobium sp. P38BS-XIX]